MFLMKTQTFEKLSLKINFKNLVKINKYSYNTVILTIAGHLLSYRYSTTDM